MNVLYQARLERNLTVDMLQVTFLGNFDIKANCVLSSVSCFKKISDFYEEMSKEFGVRVSLHFYSP